VNSQQFDDDESFQPTFCEIWFVAAVYTRPSRLEILTRHDVFRRHSILRCFVDSVSCLLFRTDGTNV